MSRFYVSPESVKGSKIYVGREESHHIIDVMRLKQGDPITVFNGTGKEYEGKIYSIKDKRVIVDVSKTKIVDKKRSIKFSLAQSIPKKEKMDLIIQKATELGVDEIYPIESSRTIVKTKGKRQHKIERWQKIAIEASKQCGRIELPRVREVTNLHNILEDITRYDLAIMPCLSEKSISFKSALRNINRPDKILVIIGPEGGFTFDEIKRASNKGAVLVSLGNLVLKSDTAAITTFSILNYELTFQK